VVPTTEALLGLARLEDALGQSIDALEHLRTPLTQLREEHSATTEPTSLRIP